MLTYDEAFQRITESIDPLPLQRHSIMESLGQVLAEDIVAPAPVPAFRNSAMDGYAIRFADLPAIPPSEDPVRAWDGRSPAMFRIVDVVRAGDPPTRPLGTNEAAQISTGAMMPEDADTVVPMEDCVAHGNELTIQGRIEIGQCVRQAGSDVAGGAVVVSRGQLIGPGAIGMFAAVGRATVKTHRKPRVAIVTTGDEIVTPGGALGRGQIYNSNGFSLAAQVVEAGGIVAKRLHAADNRESLRAAFDACAECDMLLTTGGVSVGEFDLVKEIFSERGLVDFWKVAVRPGKPLAFGRWGNVVFFGLPGNPVSSMVTFELFARPVVRKMLGHARITRAIIQAKVMEPMRQEPGRRSFLRVRISREDGEIVARLAGGQGSGMLHATVTANGLLILPEDSTGFSPGEPADVMVLNPETL